MRTLAAQLARTLPALANVRTDGDLLAGFLAHGAEDDFVELVRRHGPLVWGVCRRALPDESDAEDAFQATFLVLVRRGRKLTSYPTIGPWLHTVATLTARNLRRRNARRFAAQSALSEQIPAASTDLDLRLDIDAALLALPEKFRSPIVLCHLLGYSRADAAQRLGCAEGTLSAWLSRGLARLRARMGGLDPAKPLGVAMLTVPGVLTSSVVRAAVASRVAVTTSAVSSTVSPLVEGVLRMFWIKKATALSATVFAVFAFGVGIGMTGGNVEGVAGGQEKAATSPGNTEPVRASALDKEISELQHNLALLGLYHEKLKEVAQLAAGKGDQAASDRYRKASEDAAAEIPHLMDKLAKLKALKQTPFDPIQKPKEVEALEALKWFESRFAGQRTAPQTEQADLAKQLAELDKQIVELQVERYLLQQERRGNAAEAAELDAKIKEIETKNEELVQKRRLMAKIMRVFPESNTGHLELIVRGSATKYEFALQETDGNGKEVGTVVVDGTASGGTMLAKLLARTKADPLVPKELRVVASPSTALSGGPIAALSACDAAGYAKVKFTGYIFAGGFSIPLKADQKGEVPGYNHYDNSERKPASLIQEIQEGMRTF